MSNSEDNVPTRADVSVELAKVVCPSGKQTKDLKATRNAKRLIRVKSALPVAIFTRIESDLASYPEWEHEADNEGVK